MHAPKLGLTIAGVCGLLSAWLWLDAQAAPVPGPEPAADRSPLAPSSFQSQFDLVGSASCAARACHGGIEPVSNQRVQQNEFTTWIGQDLHADAYRVLLTERSGNIERRLRGSDSDKAVKPHEDAVCLNCHVFPNVKTARHQPGRSEEEITLFGVGCEACHGPADKWLKLHTLPDWRKNYPEPADREKVGMWPIHDALDRARRCVTCHVGSATSDMNHDLIAAGHPRLNFEFTLFMANMPRHWNDKVIKEEPSDEGIAWLLGQAVTATAALELLKHRASPATNPPDGSPKPWPEFAEYDCFACHHDLQGVVPNWRQKRNENRKPEHPPGALVWNNWYLTMPQSVAQVQGNKELLDALQRLSRAMAQPLRDRQEIIQQATEAGQRLPGLKEVVPGRRPLLRGLITEYRKSPPDWDRAAQLYLAIAALDHDPGAQKVTEELAKKLSYPQGYDSPREDAQKASDGPRSDFDKLLQQLSK